MKIIKGNLWDSEDPYILVTTNSTVRKDGGLVMGRGAAKELITLEPHLQFVFGKEVKRCGLDYGILIYCPPLGSFSSSLYHKLGVGAFQVKHHFRDKAELELIKYSTVALNRLIEGGVLTKASMNFPGIGWGHLTYEEVLPIVSQLPDSVTLYMK